MPELPLVGDEFAGYRLLAVLGRGGMSTVYQAENPRLGNVIALKVLAPELATDDVFRTRFLEESRIAAAMNHPHVIPIHDMGSTDGLLYIAMRCVSGTDLRQMISKRGRLLPDTAVFLLSQAARALDAAHRRGLVHRDVKPGNLLTERGNDDSDPDHLYLADFGITKPAIGHTGLTATGAFLGTIDYVAPEQIRGLSVLGMADQYSLGCVLYECLTGRVPFEKDLRRGDHLGARRGAADPAHAAPPRPAARHRRGVRPGAGQAAGRPVRELPRVRGRGAAGAGDARRADGGDSGRRPVAAGAAPGAAGGCRLPGARARPQTRTRPRRARRAHRPAGHEPRASPGRPRCRLRTCRRCPELAPVPEWWPQYLPSGPPTGGFSGLGGPGPGGPADPAGPAGRPATVHDADRPGGPGGSGDLGARRRRAGRPATAVAGGSGAPARVGVRADGGHRDHARLVARLSR